MFVLREVHWHCQETVYDDFLMMWLQSLSEALCNALGYSEGASAATEFPFKEGRLICKLSHILMVGVFIKKEFGQRRVETC